MGANVIALRSNEEVRASVVKAMINLRDRGKDLHKGGVFTAHNGAVQLTICISSEDNFSVHYDFYSTGWHWTIPKSEIFTTNG